VYSARGNRWGGSELKWRKISLCVCVCVCVVIRENHESVQWLQCSNWMYFKEKDLFQMLNIFTWLSTWTWVNARPCDLMTSTTKQLLRSLSLVQPNSKGISERKLYHKPEGNLICNTTLTVMGFLMAIRTVIAQYKLCISSAQCIGQL